MVAVEAFSRAMAIAMAMEAIAIAIPKVDREGGILGQVSISLSAAFRYLP